ncbi:putative holin-like toxin [Roseburia sp. 1XD42-69]|nr:putative holin-like toxin [Roseburia sp. 1XD42-69]MDE6014671.1 putative holin-like toxin [Acetatifactor sp.]
MTAADIILIFIGIIGLLIAFGSFVIALLAFLDRDKEHKRKK